MLQNLQALKQYHAALLRDCGAISNVDGKALAYKLLKIREFQDRLNYILALEKEQLEKERYQTHSMYSLQNPSIMYQESSYNLQYPCNYPIDWSSYVVTPNYDYEYYTEQFTKPSYGMNVSQIQPDPRVYGLYKGHLEDVERMCNEELRNMEDRLNSLKKIRRDWNCYEVNGTTNQNPRRIKRRIHRRRTYYYRD